MGKTHVVTLSRRQTSPPLPNEVTKNESHPHSALTETVDRGFNYVYRNPMQGGRITGEEKSAISTVPSAPPSPLYSPSLESIFSF